MSITIGPPSVEELRPRISVIGVGGAGGNAIANMIAAGIEGVDFIVANTDAQALNNAIAEHRIQLGPDITRGLGAGARPEVGRAAAEETVEEIERALEGANMVFIAAGMGGGTGTGAAPVIAEIARDKGILTVGVVTKPFLFEGTRRMRAAESGIEELQKHVDTLLVIPNQNLFLVAKAETTFKEAFQLADEVLQQGVRSITDLMVMPGLINLDFADVRSVMEEMGKAMMGTGEGEGANRALEAAERAIANPLLDGVSMKGAKGVIISIIGGEDMRLLEVDEAANHIRELVDPEANIIWGSAFNPDLEGRIRVSVVATGIEAALPQARAGSQAPGHAGGHAGGQTGGQSASLSTARGPRRPGAMPPASARPAEGARPTPASPASASPASASPAPAPAAARQWANDDDGAARARARAGAGAGEGGQADDALELTADAIRQPEPEPEPARPAQQDELLLGSEDAASPRRAPDPAPAPGLGAARRRAAPSRTSAPPAPASGAGKPGGSTLFERMAGLSRSAATAEEPAPEPQPEPEPEPAPERRSDSGSSLRIPRFLGRQNNQ